MDSLGYLSINTFKKKMKIKNVAILIYYSLLAGVVLLANYLSVNDFFNLKLIAESKPILGSILLLVWYMVFLLVGGTLLNKFIKLNRR